jgi:hypothetical protein
MAELNRFIPTPQRGLKFGSGEILPSLKKNSIRKMEGTASPDLVARDT